jgi:hypothetical protein
MVLEMSHEHEYHFFTNFILYGFMHLQFTLDAYKKIT